MDPLSILTSEIALILLLVLFAIGVNISIAFLLVAFIGIVVLLGINPALSSLSSTMYWSISSPIFAALPLFILMGGFAAEGGFAKRAYRSMYVLSLKLPGVLAVATSYACALFGAICGSSLATATVFGKIALGEMERYKYDKSLSLGVVAASGTFASMIPPSSMLILYALFTNQSIGKLFLAGVIPGIITANVYSLLIVMRVIRNPKLAPRIIGKDLTKKDKIEAIKDTWPIFLLILIVFGGIYSGFFTPTEAAAVGALATLILGIHQGKINNFDIVKKVVRESAQTTSMLFMIMIGSFFLGRFVAITHLAIQLSSFLETWDVSRATILGAILAVWFFLGMVITPAAIFALTLPIIFPIIMSLGYDPIWFGIISLKLTEIAAVSPPVGLNVYALKAVVGEGASLEDIFKGIWPFVFCDIIVLIILLIFPQIVLFLPNLILK